MRVDEYVKKRLETMADEVRVFQAASAPRDPPVRGPDFEMDHQETWNRSGLSDDQLAVCKAMKQCADANKCHNKTTNKALAVPRVYLVQTPWVSMHDTFYFVPTSQFHPNDMGTIEP